MKKLVCVAAVVALVGCETAPTPAQVAAADAGPKPDPVKILREEFGPKVMYDGASLQIRSVQDPWKVLSFDTLGTRQDTWGWAFCAVINGRNQNGGYTGWQVMSIHVRDGRILTYQDVQPASMSTYCNG